MPRNLFTTVAVALALAAQLTGAAVPPSSAQDGPLAPLATQDLSLDQATQVLAAALAAAEAQGTAMDIAVVDAGGHLKAFARMDGAWLGSIDIAVTKARTARFFDLPTEDLGALSQPGGPLYGIEGSNGGLITFPGGLPLVSADGTVLGAIGVSGSTVEEDREVAAAGVAALEQVAEAVSALPSTFEEPSGGGGLAGGIGGGDSVEPETTGQTDEIARASGVRMGEEIPT